jgi:hypothetical protein
MGLPWGAEATGKEVVATEGDEGIMLMGMPAGAHIVIPHDAGNAAEKGEGLRLPFEEGLLPLLGEGHHEGDLGVAQAHA